MLILLEHISLNNRKNKLRRKMACFAIIRIIILLAQFFVFCFMFYDPLYIEINETFSCSVGALEEFQKCVTLILQSFEE